MQPLGPTHLSALLSQGLQLNRTPWGLGCKKCGGHCPEEPCRAEPVPSHQTHPCL